MEKYEKIRIVGRGSYGTVFLCRRKDDEKSMIAKEIPVEIFTQEERQAALNEGKVLSLLHHPNIVRHYESFIHHEAITIIMEYVPGGTLHQYLLDRKGKLLHEKEILLLFSQLLLAINHVHENSILHRDLKSQNILIDRNSGIVKIGDFGISKILASKSKAVTVVGTPSYLSPELCEGKAYNKKSDIWALGCILYEMVALQRAFEADTLPVLVLKILRGEMAPIPGHVSDGLRQLLISMLHLDYNRRPSAADIMALPVIAGPTHYVFNDVGRITCKSLQITSELENQLQLNMKNFKFTSPKMKFDPCQYLNHK